jgi:hypothetical protein
MQSILNGNQVAAVKINDWTYDSLILSGQLEDAYQLLRNDVRAYLDYLDSLVV